MKLLLVLCCLTVGGLADIVLHVSQVVDSNDGIIPCNNEDDDDSAEIPPTTAKEDGELDETTATAATPTTTNADDDDSTEISPTTTMEGRTSDETTTTAATTTTTTTTSNPCGSDFYLTETSKCLRFMNYEGPWSQGESACTEGAANYKYFVPTETFNPNVLNDMFTKATKTEYYVGRFSENDNWFYYPATLTSEPACSVYKLQNKAVVEEVTSCTDNRPFLCTEPI